MDSSRFDTVARLFGNGLTRRQALRGVVSGVVTTAAGGALLASEDAEAKRHKRRRKRKKARKENQNQSEGLPPGSRCESSNQCWHDYICEVPVNGSNSDTYCCGAQGAGCGAKNEDGDDTAPYCCVGYECVYHPNSGAWTCEASPYVDPTR
jgi:hypothetical protein